MLHVHFSFSKLMSARVQEKQVEMFGRADLNPVQTPEAAAARSLPTAMYLQGRRIIMKRGAIEAALSNLKQVPHVKGVAVPCSHFVAEVGWPKLVRTTLTGQNLVCIPPQTKSDPLQHSSRDMSQNIHLT